MTSLSDKRLDDQIALISQQLAKLKRIRRARKAAQASSLARQHEARDEMIQQAYAAADGAYGVVRDLARQYQLTTRQIHRIVRPSSPPASSPSESAVPAPRPVVARNAASTGQPNLDLQIEFDL